MNSFVEYRYLDISGEKLFTIIALPEPSGKFPTVIFRTPYVKHLADKSEAELVESYSASLEAWIARGYAVVYQHCKGQGKSSGEFVPYIHEREDGLALRQWIRNQDFYNGELYLCGSSYTASLHYSTAPFEADIKGAVFEVQDSERYNLWYRNGQMRKGHANWHFGLYKANCALNKQFNYDSFSQLPLQNLSERAFSERADDFEEMLFAHRKSHKFWDTRFGGKDARRAVLDAKIPILLTTGYNDVYVGGVFDMWSQINEQNRKNCALLVSPYNHGDGYSEQSGLCFESGRRREFFGAHYDIDWFDHIRKGSPLPFKKGAITYYRTFENRWQSDFDTPKTELVPISLGSDTLSFKYDPKNPTAFCGEGNFAEESDENGNFIRVFTQPFDRDVFIKGKIRAELSVSSSCEDTSFYIRISIKKPQGAYVLRHDVTSLCYQLGDYIKNDTVTLSFSFDEYAFLLKKGECLQIDIASTDNGVYVCHTNKKGEYCLQSDTEIATNTVYLDKSTLYLPIEQEK